MAGRPVKVGPIATGADVAQRRYAVQVMDPRLEDHLLLLLRQGRMVTQVHRASQSHVDAAQRIHHAGKALDVDANPMIDRDAKVDLDGVGEQARSSPGVAGSMPNLVGYVDAAPTVGGDVDPQITRDGEQRNLFCVLVDGCDDDDVGVLSPQVCGRVESGEKEVHDLTRIGWRGQGGGTEHWRRGQGWRRRGRDGGCRRNRRQGRDGRCGGDGGHGGLGGVGPGRGGRRRRCKRRRPSRGQVSSPGGRG